MLFYLYKVRIIPDRGKADGYLCLVFFDSMLYCEVNEKVISY